MCVARDSRQATREHPHRSVVAQQVGVKQHARAGAERVLHVEHALGLQARVEEVVVPLALLERAPELGVVVQLPQLVAVAAPRPRRQGTRVLQVRGRAIEQARMRLWFYSKLQRCNGN